jgi:mRNA interferase RelE/StbE
VSYRLVYTRRAVRDIQGLDPGTKERLGSGLLRYAEDPLSHAERLTESELGSYRFRVGDYRVIFDLEGDEIVVLRVGHRREIYRRH